MFEWDTLLSREQLSPEKISSQLSLCAGLQYNSNSREDAYLHYQVAKYLYNKKDGNKSQIFQLKELFKSQYLKQYKKTEIIQFIKNMKMFQLQNDVIVHYVKPEI